MNKSAIIITYHGSSNEKSNAITSDTLTKEIKEEFNQYKVIECFSSKVVLTKLEKKRYSFKEALSFLEDNDYNKVYVLATNLVDGSDYQGLVNEAKQSSLEVIMSKPVLESNSRALAKALYKDDNNIHLFVGHGFKNKSNDEYIELQKEMRRQGYKNHYVSLIDGYPKYEDINKELDNNKNIYIYPLMFIAGFHAKRDVEQLSRDINEEFNNVEYIPVSLGMQKAIRRMYISILEDMIK